MSTDIEAVTEANAAFYQAFSNGDLKAMRSLWSASDNIAVIHPGWPPLIGREQTMNSWSRLLENGSPGYISCVDSNVNIVGSMAVVICTEVLAETELVATNIYARDSGSWQLIHHQAGPLPQSDSVRDSDTVH